METEENGETGAEVGTQTALRGVRPTFYDS